MSTGTFIYAQALGRAVIDANVLSASSATYLVGFFADSTTTNVSLGTNDFSAANLQVNFTSASVIHDSFGGAIAWAPGGIGAGATAMKTVTVTGAVVGDACQMGFSAYLPGLVSFCQITGANMATAYLYNPTSSTIAPASGTLRVTSSR